MFSRKIDINETLFQLRLATKQLDKQAAKAEKQQKAEMNKVKKALQEGPDRHEFAQLYAESAIRKKNEALNYMRLSAKLDGVSSRLKTAQAMKNMSKDLTKVTQAMSGALKSMNLEQLAKVMDKFEGQFEDLDVHASVMENSMGSAMASSAPTDQVEALIKQVADENGLEVQAQLEAARVGSTQLPSESEATSSTREDDLEKRLRAIRN